MNDFVKYRRVDGTFVAIINGNPYHITHDDPLHSWAFGVGAESPLEPDPDVIIASVPQSISRFQARAALLAAGRLADVEAAVAAADPFSQIAWAEAQEWRRDSPTLDALAKGIGLTDAEIDDLFIQAAAIRA